MMVLSQDTTKSLLLEYSLIKADEKGFFETKNVNQNNDSVLVDFIENNTLNIGGKLYIENNRIIIDALKDFEIQYDEILKNSKDNKINLPYYMDNFIKLYTLNVSDYYNKFNTAFIKNYNNINSTIEATIKNSNKIENLDKNINLWIKSINENDSIKIITFVRDNSQKNKLFEFFMLEDKETEEETKQFFYDDKNLNKIRNMLKENINEDVIFDDGGSSLIIKFCSNLDVSELSKYNTKNCENTKNGETIYFQVLNFDSKKICHWFMIKLLMTLRNKISDLINKINLSVLISERSKSIQGKALAINKAVTHSSAGSFFVSDLTYNEESIEPYMQRYKKAEYENVLYDKYNQLLANEFISSLYRKIIKGKTEQGERIYGKTIKQMIKYTYDILKEGETENIYEMWFAVCNAKDYKLEKVQIRFHFEENFHDDIEIKQWPMKGGIASIIHLIWLMSMNAIEHGISDEEGKYVVDIVFSKKSISFQNKISSNIKDKLDKILNVPPWCFPTDDQHITLWSLNHYNIGNVNCLTDDTKFSVSFEIMEGV